MDGRVDLPFESHRPDACSLLRLPRASWTYAGHFGTGLVALIIRADPKHFEKLNAIEHPFVENLPSSRRF